MHSPPRPLTVKYLQDWIIQPGTSDWKNPIPLDKSLAADGRGLQEVQMNDNLSEALYVAEKKAREAAAILRSKVQKEKMMMKEELRALAVKARSERKKIRKERRPLKVRALAAPSSTESEREKIREERRREGDGKKVGG
ncbi:hypothetical protein PTKIN_Ptkin12aG0004000 [Pterospermum kingtungense]